MKQWTKAIPETRDRLQSRALVWTVGVVLVVWCLPNLFEWTALIQTRGSSLPLWAGSIGLTFAIVVWALRAATPMAALAGGSICFITTILTAWLDEPVYRSSLIPLMTLFVLTFAATRLGRRRKQALGLAESRKGRNAAQVTANLGASALLAIGSIALASPFQPARLMVLGVLAEATADTVSSEIGSVFGGRPFLITTGKRVAAGTDGAVSILGTVAGLLAAALIALAGMWSMNLDGRLGFAAWLGGCAGLLFDSLLGATLERRGWLGNDLVNFSSTVVGGLSALVVAGLLHTR